MAPRAKGPSDSTAEPRRSTRISALPQAKSEPVKRQAAAKPKKRAADAAVERSENVPAAKKTKGADDADREEAIGAEDEAEDAPALQSIDVGDNLPSYILKNEKDENVDVAALAADKGVVLFLIPKADTPGCTQQACGFRDSYPDFTSQYFDVYCLSADKPAAQTKWQTKKNLPYPLLSDPERVLITALGAGEGGKTKRSHFIFEKGGKLVEKKLPVKPVDSPKLALEFVQGLNQ